jgi:hypothetical protein
MTLRIDSQEPTDACVFRAARFTGQACERALWCRLEITEDDWRLSFYDHKRGAAHAWEPLTSIDRERMDLAVEAISHAQVVVKGWFANRGK